MKRNVLVKQVIERSDGPLTPTATRLFNVVKTGASECIAHSNRGHSKRSCTGLRKDEGNKGSTIDAGKKRPRSEITTGTSQAAKKPKHAHVSVQTRS
ncbi:hypothetical protein Tco_1486834, partial [Tanacetum coccineum]